MDDKKFDEYILKLFDRVFEKMDKLSDYMDKLNEILTRNTVGLEYHIKRTDQNESEITLNQERMHTLESRMMEELARIQANSKKHEENDILRFAELQKSVAKDIDSKFGEVLPLVKQVCDDLQERQIREKIEKDDKKARKEKILFWIKVLGAVGTILGIAAAVKVL